jgi:hypothetical protein
MAVKLRESGREGNTETGRQGMGEEEMEEEILPTDLIGALDCAASDSRTT